MESQQCPHKKLSEDEIKDKISTLCFTVQELRDHVLDRIDFIDGQLYLLKRHFCPEKFQQVNVSMQDIGELIEQTYGKIDLAGQTRRMTKYKEADDGVAETEQV